MAVKLENLFKYCIPHGELIIYGDNMSLCKPYINDIDQKTVENICMYCQQHDLRVFHKPDKNLRGYLEIPRVARLTKKYYVYSNWDDVLKYLETQQIDE